MAKLDELGLKRLIENIDKNLNLKVNNIKDTLADNVSFTQDILKTEWELVEGSYKYAITHPLKTQRLAVTAIDTVTKDRIFIHDKAISDNAVELEIDSPQDVTVIIINGSTEIKALEIPFDDNNTSTLTTWSSEKIQSELDKKSTDAKSTTFDNSINGMTSTNVQDAIEENNTSIKSIDAEFDKPLNTSYQTINGIKEFECKDGYVNNVTIEGKTLVNLCLTGNNTLGAKVLYTNAGRIDINRFKPSTKYTAILFDSTNKSASMALCTMSADYSFFLSGDTNGKRKHCFTTPSTIDTTKTLQFFTYGEYVSGDETKISVLILEGDYTNISISHFEGLKSVGQGDKIEVLSCSDEVDLSYLTWNDGKAILGTNGQEIDSSPHSYANEYINVDESKSYYGFLNKNIVYYNENKQVIPTDHNLNIYAKPSYFYTGDNGGYVDIIMPKGTKFIRINSHTNNKQKICLYAKQDKKRILSTLRSVNDTAKDIVYKQGDKYYKIKRCEEVVLNGNENTILLERTGTNTLGFVIKDVLVNHKSTWNSIINDKLNVVAVYGNDIEGIQSNNGNPTWVHIGIAKTKLTTTQDLNGFKTWLQSNPITIVYELATPIIEELPNFNPRCFDNKTTLLLNSGVVQADCNFEVTNSLRSELEVLKAKTSDLDDNIIEREIHYPTLLNGWSDAETTLYGKMFVIKDGNIVHLCGRITSGIKTSGTLLFSLPQIFRPSKSKILTINTYSAFTSPLSPVIAIINPAGNCYLYGSNVGTELGFSISYSIEGGA